MNELDDTDRAAYLASRYEQVKAERFDRIPWAEAHAKPVPRHVAIHRAEDTPQAIARRRRVLNRMPADELPHQLGRAA